MATTVTSQIQGITINEAVKAPCAAVATSNVTLSGYQTISGVTITSASTNKRVLVSGQSDPVENGIYNMDSSTWQRAKDFDGNRDVVQGTLVVVNSGSDVYFRVTTANPITIGTTAITFEAVSGSAITQSVIGALLWPISPAESAATLTNADLDRRYPWGDVRRYLAVGDNVADDSDPISNCLAQWVETGGAPPWFEPGKTYFCGNRSAGEVVFQIDNAVRTCMYMNGARVRVNTTDDSVPVVFQFRDPRNLTVYKPGVTDSGWEEANPLEGAIAFDIMATGATDEDIGHVTLEDVDVESLVLPLRVRGNATGQTSTNQVNRIRNVRMSGRSKSTFYCFNLQNHGDDCDINMHCENLHRAAFGYGVAGLNFDMHVKNPRGGYAHVLCKAYDRSTEGWRGRIFLETAASGFEALLFEFQNDDADQDESIRDIDIELNMRNMPLAATPVTFRAFDNVTPNPNIRATTTNHFDNIRLRGDWTNFSTPFVFATRQTTEGRLILNPSLANQLPTYQDFSGFVLLKSIDEEVRSVTGNLTTSTITIPCARYEAQAFDLEVTTSIRDDTDGGTSAAAILTQRDIIRASNSGAGGPVSILDTLNLFRYTRASASVPTLGTITYTASGENIVVSFSVHTDVTSHARVDVKHLRGYC